MTHASSRGRVIWFVVICGAAIALVVWSLGRARLSSSAEP